VTIETCRPYPTRAGLELPEMVTFPREFALLLDLGAHGRELKLSKLKALVVAILRGIMVADGVTN